MEMSFKAEVYNIHKQQMQQAKHVSLWTLLKATVYITFHILKHAVDKLLVKSIVFSLTLSFHIKIPNICATTVSMFESFDGD